MHGTRTGRMRRSIGDCGTATAEPRVLAWDGDLDERRCYTRLRARAQHSRLYRRLHSRPGAGRCCVVAPNDSPDPRWCNRGRCYPELPAEPLPEPVEDAAFPIPPVPERPFGVEEGDRIFVESFEIRGANARPKHGIALEELSDLVEKIRIEGQGLGEVGEDGFTEDERKEVLSFFKRVVELREFDDYLYDDYSDLVTQLREERLVRRAGLTIGQLQEVADQVTKYYKDKGFVLAQAFIPAQEVEDGKVVIEVVEGRLGRVIAQGNEGYPSDLLAAPFEDLVDSPVSNAAIESAILTLRDYPGLTPTAVFRPGARVGTADLVLSVQREKPYDVSINIDNNGSKFTGERRITVDARWNNPTGAGDVLAAQVLQAWKPKNSVFYSVTYERPIWPGAIAHGEVSRQILCDRRRSGGTEYHGCADTAQHWFAPGYLPQPSAQYPRRFEPETHQFGAEVQQDRA